MNVGVFYNSISNPAKFPNKTLLMDNFKLGVVTNGDCAIDFVGGALPITKLDAGFVLGYTLENNFRRRIIESLTAQKTPIVYVDSNILHYANPEHEWHRYSLNSVYPNSGIYFFDQLNPDKWRRFSHWHNVKEQPWRTNGNHILILCQRPNGWNMVGANQQNWLADTINAIRKISDRTIRLRMHPGDKTRFDEIKRLQNLYKHSIEISNNANIRDDLKNCWATVGYNSTPNVVAAIEGIPCYVANPELSWAADVAFTNLQEITDPPMPDRDMWLNKIANIHWSNGEVKSGVLWSAIKKYISASQK